MFIKFFPSLFFPPVRLNLHVQLSGLVFPKTTVTQNGPWPTWHLAPPPSDMLPVVLLIIHLATGLSHGWRSHFGFWFFFTLKKTNALVPHAATDSFYIPRSPFSRLRNVCNGNHSPGGTSARVVFWEMGCWSHWPIADQKVK